MTSANPRYASPVDTATFGEYRIVRDPDDPRPLYRFRGRVPEGTEPGRYHLYSGWFCPWAQRVVITRTLAGLEDVVSLSYVDQHRDARGWAFREANGPDRVNGFTLLREAYDATEPGFDGHVSVPTLWDRATGTVASNEYRTIGVDLATRFRHLAEPVVDTYPADLAEPIEDLDRWLGPAVNHGVYAAAGGTLEAEPARSRLLAAFADLNHRLAARRFLLGDRLTEADIRLWVTLVRFDVGPNADRSIVDGLHVYEHLWSYARDLYGIPAFRDSTDFSTFTRPGATVADWDEPARRGALDVVGAR